MRDLTEINVNDGGKPVGLPLPTSTQIAAIENLVGMVLPESYVNFLKCSNGGHPELDTIETDDGKVWAVNRLFHIAATAGDLSDTEDVVWRYHHRWPGARRELLPIANDGGDNLFCLDLSRDGNGQIVCYIHDEPGSPLIHIASSFEALIDALVVNPDYI